MTLVTDDHDRDAVPCFTLSFRPNTALVSTVRRFVLDFYQCCLTPDLTSQVALATHELLENAVLHSSNGETEVHIEITPLTRGQSVCIRTRNAATPQDVGALHALFAELDAVTNPDEFYQSMMRRSAQRADGSGLGLARILAETQMAMTLEVNGDDVCISARMDTQRSLS